MIVKRIDGVRTKALFLMLAGSYLPPFGVFGCALSSTTTEAGELQERKELK